MGKRKRRVRPHARRKASNADTHEQTSDTSASSKRGEARSQLQEILRKKRELSLAREIRQNRLKTQLRVRNLKRKKVGPLINNITEQPARKSRKLAAKKGQDQATAEFPLLGTLHASF